MSASISIRVLDLLLTYILLPFSPPRSILSAFLTCNDWLLRYFCLIGEILILFGGDLFFFLAGEFDLTFGFGGTVPGLTLFLFVLTGGFELIGRGRAEFNWF